MIPVPGRKVYENSSFDLREARNARKFASVLQANPRKLMNLDVYLCFSLSLSLSLSLSRDFPLDKSEIFYGSGREGNLIKCVDHF